MKKFILIGALFLMVSGGFSQSNNKDYSQAFELINVWMEAQKNFDRLPGISAVVVKDQEVLWTNAFGMSNLNEDMQAEPSTLYSICSISKLFTSVAIMKLYDEGKLRLDDRVSDLLPWFDIRQQFPETSPVTVRTLMTHSSGLPREANFPYWTGPDFPFPQREQIIDQLENQETLYPASVYFQYSNLGLSLLGEIVQEISGMPFETYIQTHILQSLGLEDTRTTLPENLYGKELALGYSAFNRQGDRNQVSFFQANGIGPAAGFSSNVLDLGKFASWQFRLYDAQTPEIIKPSTLKYMQNVHWTDPDFTTTWGLGFAVFKGPDGSKWVGHGGSCPGYRSTLRIHPQSKMAFSVMINAMDADPNKYFKGIHEILNKVSMKEDDDQEDTTDIRFADYKGFYSQQPWGSESYFMEWEGKLLRVYLPSDSPASSMVFYNHVEGDTFRRIRDDEQPGETLSFERDEQGMVYRVKSHNNYSPRIIR